MFKRPCSIVKYIRRSRNGPNFSYKFVNSYNGSVAQQVVVRLLQSARSSATWTAEIWISCFIYCVLSVTHVWYIMWCQEFLFDISCTIIYSCLIYRVLSGTHVWYVVHYQIFMFDMMHYQVCVQWCFRCQKRCKVDLSGIALVRSCATTRTTLYVAHKRLEEFEARLISQQLSQWHSNKTGMCVTLHTITRTRIPRCRYFILHCIPLPVHVYHVAGISYYIAFHYPYTYTMLQVLHVSLLTMLLHYLCYIVILICKALCVVSRWLSLST